MYSDFSSTRGSRSVSYFSTFRTLPTLTGSTVGVLWKRTINVSVVASWGFRSMHWKFRIRFTLRADACVILAHLICYRLNMTYRGPLRRYFLTCDWPLQNGRLQWSLCSTDVFRSMVHSPSMVRVRQGAYNLTMWRVRVMLIPPRIF